MDVKTVSPGMRRLTAAVEAVMSGADPGRRGLAALLQGAAGLYGAGMHCRAGMYRRRWLPSHRLPCRVVAVGNITVGGTGKTPMTLYLAEMIHKAGYRVAVISRGYQGAAERRGGVVSDGRRLGMGAAEAGDEPRLMARRLLPLGIPVLVGHDRLRSGRLAVERFRSEVILLDDAFQHLRLARDLDLVLLDAAKPFGNGHLLPRGTLREPLAALSRADACLLTRCPSAAVRPAGGGLPESLREAVRRPRRPIFPAAHAPFVAECIIDGRAVPHASPTPFSASAGSPVYAFSGIARNDTFRRSLREMGFTLRGWTDFADHHAYTAESLAAVVKAARQCGAEWGVTTLKDRVKIAADWVRDLPLLVIDVRMDLGIHRGAFEDFVGRRLGLAGRG